jgi:hypothetical protein
LIQKAVFEWAFQDVRQKQTRPLKLHVEGVGRLAGSVDSHSFQYLSRLAMKISTWSVKEVAFFQWGESTQ